MSKNGKFVKKGSSGKSNSKLIIALSCIAALLAILVIVLILLIPRGEEPAETTAPPIPTESIAPTTEEPTTVPPTTIPEETEAQMMDWIVEYYEKNPEIAGWITIGGTKADNPVMYVKDDNYKYLYANFEGQFNVAGVPYIRGSCSIDPESDNLIIYGHNMLDGSMFGELSNFADEKFWREHPTVTFSTLYEVREYEIVAAFYDRLYEDHEDVFKFYEFIEAVDEEHFNEAIAYYKEHAEYDTGITPEYGDHLITLVTCSYHTTDGRFVVVARRIVEEPETDTTPTE